jgi:EAL domain-containing protein (putative c-di-GMP-specific phosphodiesterase class I)/GGDEF domain-containing protein
LTTTEDLLSDITRCAALPGGAAVLVVGVDRFARIRAAIGYDPAEKLMTALGSRILSLGPRVGLARLSPDTICVWGAAFMARNEGGRFLQDARCALEDSFELQGHRLHAAVRIGFTVGSGSGAELLHEAELALDQAREHCKSIQQFSREEYGDPLSRLALLDELRVGLVRGDVKLYYQPQVRPRTGEVVAVEALMRWESPTRGLVPPNHFIPTAEETGQIRDLTQFAVRRAIEDAGALSRAGFPLRVGVNISSRLLTDRGFIRSVLADLSGSTARMTFEITESLAIEDWSMAIHHLKLLSSAGVRLSIDDYGAGMSSLAYVQQLPAQELKIDRQFISQITHSHRDPLLVRSTIELGHALELEVVGEGVEDPETLALLTIMGCDLVQGYFVGVPMPVEDLLGYLRSASGEAKVKAPLPTALLFGG